jgi:hypothetical protein
MFLVCLYKVNALWEFSLSVFFERAKSWRLIFAVIRIHQELLKLNMKSRSLILPRNGSSRSHGGSAGFTEAQSGFIESHLVVNLKWQSHEIFYFCFFHQTSSLAPVSPLKTFLLRTLNSPWYSNLNLTLQCQWHSRINKNSSGNLLFFPSYAFGVV